MGSADSDRLAGATPRQGNEAGGAGNLSRPISPWRACWLLVGMRTRRKLALITTGLSAPFGKAKRVGRTATAGKKKSGWALPIIVGSVMAYNTWNISQTIITRAEERFGDAGLVSATALLMFMLCATLILAGVGMANQELAKLDWDMEWLLSLPVSAPVIYAMKIAERTATNFLVWLSAGPFLFALVWHSGLRYSAPIATLVLCLPLFVTIAAAQVVVEVAARTYLPAFGIRNLQAVASIAGLVGLFVVMSPALGAGETDYFMWHWMQRAQDLAWLPLSRPAVIALGLGGPGQKVLFHVSGYLAETAAVLYLCWLGLRAAHRLGAVAGRGALMGRRHSSTSGPLADGVAQSAEPPRGLVRRMLSGPVGKDLRKLVRDRSFLTQTLILPGLALGAQIFINPAMFSSLSSDPQHLCAAAFGLGAYLLIISTSQILNAEGPALWILFTLPRRLDRIMLRKALMWAPFAAMYTCAVLLYGLVQQGFSNQLAVGGIYALIGLPIYAVIGGALGIYGTDPTVQEQNKRLRLDILYLFMVLEALYVYGIYRTDLWPKLSLIVLISALALALWQNTMQRLPYLLDPVSLPPPTVSLADGLMAVLVFAVLQGLLTVAALKLLHLSIWPSQLLAFSCAGVIAVLGVLFVLWRRKVPGLRPLLGLTLGRGAGATLGDGLLWGLPAMAVAIGYNELMARWPWLASRVEEMVAAAEQPSPDPASPYWLFALAVIAAPLCEEILFRGIVFRGLRRSTSFLGAALMSSAVFAVAHSAIAAPAVFLMALCAAKAFERSRSLLAAMLVHAMYNAVCVLYAVGGL